MDLDDLDELLAAARDPDADERLRAAAELPIRHGDGPRDAEIVTALITLTTDLDPGVRDWATMGLGVQIDVDSPQVRAALWARIGDRGGDTHYEALHGLARRRDPLAAAMVADELGAAEVPSLVFRAAAHLRESAFADRIWDFYAEDMDEDDVVRLALRECDPGLRAERDAFGDRLFDLLSARAAAYRPSLSCDVLDLDVVITMDSIGGSWDLDVMRHLSGGDPEKAADRIIAQLPELPGRSRPGSSGRRRRPRRSSRPGGAAGPASRPPA